MPNYVNVMLRFVQSNTCGVKLNIWLQPGSSRNSWVAQIGEEIKIAVNAPPVEGAANEALCVFLAKSLRLPKSSVRITRGLNGRHKVVLLEGNSQVLMARLKDVLKANNIPLLPTDNQK